MNHLVTVLMPCYREPLDYFDRAVNSILQQTYKNIELLIILDDPQNLVLREAGENYQRKDSRVSFHVNPENLKLTKTLNRGIKIANGDVIARLDADDIALKTRISAQIKYVDEYDLISSNFALINEAGSIVRHRTFPSDHQSIYKYLIENADCMYHTTWLGRKETFEALHGYREIGPFEDYDFLLRGLSHNMKFYNCAEELNLYRINTQGISSNNKIWQHLGSEYIREHYKEIEKIGPLDIEKYINSATGKKHTESYQEFYKFVSIFYQSKNSTDYYKNLLRYGPFLACCNYYGRKKVLAKLRELF